MSGRLAALLAAALLVAGCGGTAEAPPADTYYRLDVAAPAPQGDGTLLDGALVVRRFGADGTVSQRPLVYADAGSRHALHQYSYHLWADPPPRMAQELTVDMLRAASVAAPVVTPEVRVDARYELTGKIKLFEHLRGEASSVVVGLEFHLHRLSDGQLLLVQDYVVERPAADASVTEATRAMNEALGEIYARLVTDIAAL